MHKVFVSGSMTIKRIDSAVVSRLENILSSGIRIIVGDANGVDKSIQTYLLNRGTSSVVVYCAGRNPRNNAGHWEVKHIRTNAKPGTRAFFTAKDLAMADDCDYGLMIWDAKSIGTLSNAMELLKRKKPAVVFINGSKRFVNVKEIADVQELIGHMSEVARTRADKKIGLSRKIEKIQNEQLAMF